MGLSSGITRYQYITGKGGQQNTAEDIYPQASTWPGTWQMVPLTKGTHVPVLKVALLWRQRPERGTEAAAATLDVTRGLLRSPTQIPGSPWKSMPWQ